MSATPQEQLNGTYMCPACGVETPHNHDVQDGEFYFEQRDGWWLVMRRCGCAFKGHDKPVFRYRTAETARAVAEVLSFVWGWRP